MKERLLIDGKQKGDETWLESSIRPRRLVSYIGQTAVREQMEIFVQAARCYAANASGSCTQFLVRQVWEKQRSLNIIANEMSAWAYAKLSGPVLEKAGDVSGVTD